MTIDKPSPMEEKSKSLNSLVTALTLVGIFGVLAGAINLLGGLSSGLSPTRLADVLFNIVDGILLFICSRVLAKGRVLAIWLFIFIILFSLVYSFIMARGFNFISAAFGALVLWHLFSLKKKNELS